MHAAAGAAHQWDAAKDLLQGGSHCQLTRATACSVAQALGHGMVIQPACVVTGMDLARTAATLRTLIIMQCINSMAIWSWLSWAQWRVVDWQVT
jgi:uncharacterized membrane protein (DUF2068 family)